MATTKVINNQNKFVTSRSRTTTITTVTDKCSLWLVIVTGITILLAVIIGICAKFLLEPYIGSIILIALICFEVLIGVIVLTILSYRRKKYATTQKTTMLRKNGQYHGVRPTAPLETSWEYSNRETMPA